jgi:hypothetical protein
MMNAHNAAAAQEIGPRGSSPISGTTFSGRSRRILRHANKFP